MAANIHAGNLNKAITPSPQELMAIPFFDKTTKEDFANLHYTGQDESGNEVYILGTRHSDFGSTINGLVALMGISQDFVFTNTMPYVNPILRIGGYLSRGLSKPALGRPLVFRGARAAYPALVSLVERIKVQCI